MRAGIGGRMVVLAVAALAGLAACVGPGVEGRFRDQPIVWRLADRSPIAEPARRSFGLTSYVANALFFRRIQRAVVPPGDRPAGNINALDEVPDSTWFTNRIGRVGQLAAEELGPGAGAGLPVEAPLRLIEARREEGEDPHIEVVDGHGARYRLVFDTEKNPEQRTAAAVVSARVLWALGYNVPSHQIVHFRLDDLVVGADALPATRAAVDAAGLSASALEEALARASRRPSDGRLRALAMGALPGVEKGGWRSEGKRKDDLNDSVRHEHRRELRGLRVFSSWINFTDIKENNTVDLWVRGADGGYLRHYLTGFARTLGAYRAEAQQNEIGWEYAWDIREQAKAIVSLGLYTRPWELETEGDYLSVGRFSAAAFDPARWRELYPYWPFWMLDRADAYWAAKLVMAFDRDTIAAVVDAAELSDEGAANYLREVLWARRARIGARYFAGVTPVDWFELSAKNLCMTDLATHYGVAYGGAIEQRTRGGELERRISIGPGGRLCVPIAEDDAYRVLRLRAVRAGATEPEVHIHYRGGTRPRILGVVRVAGKRDEDK